jgi:uncharacterized protein YukE
MKFIVGSGGETLTTMTKQTDSTTQDLATLLQQLAQAGEPIRDSFQGRGRVLFDEFHKHAHADGVILNKLLASIAEGVGGMDSSYFDFEQQSAETAQRISGSAPYSSGSFA